MIAYLKGTLLKKRQNRVILLVNQVGYEVLLPVVIRQSLEQTASDEAISFHIYHHQTERQPKPVLIGFDTEDQKEFFQLLISVEAIGPLKAVQAMTIPISEIATAIESKDAKTLQLLNGIGVRTAQKIIATLEGKVGKFAGTTIEANQNQYNPPEDDWVEATNQVLVEQLGHKPTVARQMIQEALLRDSSISTAENLLDEVLRQN